MSIPAMSTVGIKAAVAYGRADGLVTPVPPPRRDPQPVRPDFVEALSQRRGPARPETVEPDGAAGQRLDGIETGPAQRRARPLSQPFSAFVAQAIAQDGDDTPPPSAFRIGAAAYGTGTSAGASPQVEILSPFPRLASGRTLDLTV